MTSERVCSPEELVGHSVSDVISFLPTFRWHIDRESRQYDVKIGRLVFVSYDTWKPRIQPDLYHSLEVVPGCAVPEQRLVSVITPRKGRTIGVTSLVCLDGDNFDKKNGIGRGSWAHLPLIDMDLDADLSRTEALQLIKRELRKTGVGNGLILCSGKENHYHFIGTERLLTEDQLPTFVGLCLFMFDQNKKVLIDPRWAGHTLTPMKYLTEMGRAPGLTNYDLTIRFATLRVSINEKKLQIPEVVDIFDY